MKKVVCLSIVCMLSLGCGTTVGNKQITSPTAMSQIEKGKTTKDEVTAAIGQPNTVSFFDNEEHWHYVYKDLTVRPTTFIPYVGLFLGGADQTNYNTTIVFDQNGVVKNVGSGKTTGSKGGIKR